MRLLAGDALYPYLSDIAALIHRDLPGIDVTQAQAIAVVDETVLAVILYDRFTGADIHMHIASASPKWCNRKVLRGLFRYPFEQLSTRRVTAMTTKSNKVARQFLERLGFRLEGTHPQSGTNGETMCSYGLLRRDCRWVNGKEITESAPGA